MDSKKKNLTVCILFGLLLAVAFSGLFVSPQGSHFGQ
mgnify:CR=1 FL=1